MIQTKQRILNALAEHGPASSGTIADTLGLCRSTVKKHVAALRSIDPPLVRIKRWERSSGKCGGPMIPLYATGRTDASKPKPLTQTEKNRNTRARRKGTPHHCRVTPASPWSGLL